jgi:mTERF domain-containing protein
MLKFNSWRHKTLIYYLKGLTSPQTLQSQNPNPIFQHYPSSFSLHFCTNNSDSNPFAVSYLINKFGFSPQSASRLTSTHRLKFKTAKNPDSVLAFFRNHGFSDTQLRDIIAKSPDLLSCNPSKRVLPKFQFFLSKGASNSYIVDIVSKNPRILSASLKNCIVPTYELVYRFLQSDNETIGCVVRNRNLLCDNRVPNNVTMLVENGVSYSNIARLFRTRSMVLHSRDLLKLVEEVKDLGFNPSKIIFSIALIAKASVTKTLWKEKVDALKKWGWSDGDALEAFRKKPYCMLTSIDKINLVMSFWVNQMGWDAMAIAKTPYILSLSLEKRIIPRAAVVRFLLDKGLKDKIASPTYPFVMSEELFLDMLKKRFKDESSYLLKLYEQKLMLANIRD